MGEFGEFTPCKDRLQVVAIVRGDARSAKLDASRGFTESEWLLVRIVADGLETSCCWSKPAAQRQCFLLDFAYATSIRASELIGATLGSIRVDAHRDHWLHLTGKEGRRGMVALPPLTRIALNQYLAQHGLSVARARQDPNTHLNDSLGQDGTVGITGARLWCFMRRFFTSIATNTNEHRRSPRPSALENLCHQAELSRPANA